MAWLDPKDASPEAWAGETAQERASRMRRLKNQQTFSKQSKNKPPSVPPTEQPTVGGGIDSFESVSILQDEGPIRSMKVQYEAGDISYPAILTCYLRKPFVKNITGFSRAMERWRSIDNHHAVAQVINYGENPYPWVAIEAIEKSLHDFDLPLKTKEALWIISRIASALDTAHGYGIIHSNITPRTVVFEEVWEETAWDYPKLCEFGLWYEIFANQRKILGVNPKYTAPEQIKPDIFGPVDASTDIYQLGQIAYEILTGNPPFTGSRRRVLQETVQSEPTPLDQLNPTVPESLSLVISKCLRREKLTRYETVQAFRHELSDVL